MYGTYFLKKLKKEEDGIYLDLGLTIEYVFGPSKLTQYTSKTGNGSLLDVIFVSFGQSCRLHRSFKEHDHDHENITAIQKYHTNYKR